MVQRSIRVDICDEQFKMYIILLGGKRSGQLSVEVAVNGDVL